MRGMTTLRAHLNSALQSHSSGRAALGLLIRAKSNRMAAEEADALIEALGGPGLGVSEVEELSGTLEDLIRRGHVVLRPQDGAFTVCAKGAQFRLHPDPVPPATPLKLSRFTHMSFEDGQATIRHPLSDRFFQIHDAAVARIVTEFARPRAPSEMPDDEAGTAIELAKGGMLLPCDAEGLCRDDREPARRMWEFHDLLFHARTRAGLAEGRLGGTFEFRGVFDERVTAPSAPPVLRWCALPTPDDTAPSPPLFDVLAGRRSVRRFAATPLPLAALGAFLHHSVREGGGRRPYPNGGALYEQVFYLAIDKVEGMDRGLYVYDGPGHRLGLLKTDGAQLDALLADAALAMGQRAAPPVLVVIASQFARVRWKYSGISYALQVKHVGVLQEAMYLVATALELGGCALGVGDSERFGLMTGLDILQEGSIGEFALGVPADVSGRDS